MSGSFLLYIGTACALIFVIEGMLYTLFPGGVRKMFELALSMPERQLRVFGAFMAALGFCLIWLLQSISGG